MKAMKTLGILTAGAAIGAIGVIAAARVLSQRIVSDDPSILDSLAPIDKLTVATAAELIPSKLPAGA